MSWWGSHEVKYFFYVFLFFVLFSIFFVQLCLFLLVFGAAVENVGSTNDLW